MAGGIFSNTAGALLALLLLGCAASPARAAPRALQQFTPDLKPVTVPQNPILVNASTATRTKPQSPCPDIDNLKGVDPATLMPPGGPYRPIIKLQGSGSRIFACNPDGTINPDSKGEVQYTGDFVGRGGYNSDGLPQIWLKASPQAQEGTLLLDSTRVLFPAPDRNTSWGRWPVAVISGADLPWVDFLTRVNTSGPLPATSCTPGENVTAPFEAAYVFWTCAAPEASPPKGGVVAAAGPAGEGMAAPAPAGEFADGAAPAKASSGAAAAAAAGARSSLVMAAAVALLALG